MKYKLYYVKYGEAFCGRHTALKPAVGKLNRFQKEWHASNKKGTTLKDSNQPVHPPSMAWVLIYPSLDSPEAVEGT